MEYLVVICPRCQRPVEQEFYGPCAACRSELRALRPTAPDPHFTATNRQDGSHQMQFKPCADPACPRCRAAD